MFATSRVFYGESVWAPDHILDRDREPQLIAVAEACGQLSAAPKIGAEATLPLAQKNVP